MKNRSFEFLKKECSPEHWTVLLTIIKIAHFLEYLENRPVFLKKIGLSRLSSLYVPRIGITVVDLFITPSALVAVATDALVRIADVDASGAVAARRGVAGVGGADVADGARPARPALAAVRVACVHTLAAIGARLVVTVRITYK